MNKGPAERGLVRVQVWMRPSERAAFRFRARSQGLTDAAFFRSLAFPVTDDNGRPVDVSSSWLSRKISRDEACFAHDALSRGARLLEAEARGMRRVDPGDPRAVELEGAALDWRTAARTYRRIVDDYDALEAARAADAATRPAPPPPPAARRPTPTAALGAALAFGRRHRAPVA